MTSIGAPASSWFMARAAVTIGCRCRRMSARRSPPTCGADGRRAIGARCSCKRGSVCADRVWHGRLDGPSRVPTRRDRRGRLASAAPHHGVRDGQGGGADRADRAGAAAPQPAEHRDLRARGHRTAPAARRTVARAERTMSTLSDHADEYLRARRALGVKLERCGRLLPQLVAYLEAAGASTITRELASAWAKLPGGRHP